MNNTNIQALIHADIAYSADALSRGGILFRFMSGFLSSGLFRRLCKCRRDFFRASAPARYTKHLRRRKRARGGHSSSPREFDSATFEPEWWGAREKKEKKYPEFCCAKKLYTSSLKGRIIIGQFHGENQIRCNEKNYIFLLLHKKWNKNVLYCQVVKNKSS